ncbi:hypothetical protein LguiA_026588 [Lonicera macranthoides]
MASTKAIAETPELSFLPSSHPYFEKHNELESVNAEDSIPTIDFSLLTMGSPDQRSKVIHDLGKFCQEWGFFLVTDEFFNLKDEEKKEFETKLPLAPISCGNSFHNADKKNIFLWRDYLKMFAVNLYPPCPNPEAAMGLPPHTDHGLLTLLMQNGVEGLQIQHNGKWVIINEIPNSFIVNVGDQLEIFSNGKYKSVMHRAIVNDKIKRLSIAMPHGPSLDTIVAPSFNLLECTSQQSAYIPMNYKEYIEQMIIQAMKGKPILEQVRIQRE